MKHDNTVGRNYKQLVIDQRETLAILQAQRTPVKAIAQAVGCHRSTIYRERKRNLPDKNIVEYRANRAQLKADWRKRESHRRLRLKSYEIRKYVRTKLRLKWSPEEIANRIIRDYPGWKTNYESIYQYIYYEYRVGIECLRHAHRTRRRRGSAKGKRSIRIPNRVMIAQRPKEVEERKAPGHLEADTMVSRKSKAAVAVVIDRCTRKINLMKIRRKTAKQMDKVISQRLCELPPDRLKTITYDNGTENALHEKTNKTLGTKSYFCNPYHSWEKGSVENSIGWPR